MDAFPNLIYICLRVNFLAAIATGVANIGLYFASSYIKEKLDPYIDGDYIILMVIFLAQLSLGCVESACLTKNMQACMMSLLESVEMSSRIWYVVKMIFLVTS